MKKTFNVTEITHFNPDTGWFVANTDSMEKVVGSSIIPPYGSITVDAEYSKAGRYGPQWKVETVMFKDIEDITMSLLSSGIVAEIRESKAQEIFSRFGSKIWGILDACVKNIPIVFNGEEWVARELLMTAKGVKKVVSNDMIESWRENRMIFTTAINAVRCGLTIRQFRRVTEDDLTRAEFDMMVHNTEPYNVYDMIHFGLSFEQVDEIALTDWDDKPAIEPMSRTRLAGAVKKVLADFEKDGHVCAPSSDVETGVWDLIGVEEVLTVIGDLRSVRLIMFGDYVYKLPDYDMEVETARMLRDIQKLQQRTYNLSAEEIRRYADFDLSDEQVAAIQMILTEKVCILTGEPGTGKTTILKVAVQILQERIEKTVLCAFMGATARRMQKATGAEASTLHSYFGLFKPKEDREVMTNGYLFIDEVSTMSSDLFRDTVAQLTSHVRLVLIGDADQLPPVGKGEVFLQLINSGVIPVMRLTQIYRNGGAIALGCHEVNAGRMPVPDNKDFYFIETGEIPSRLEKAYLWLREKNPDLESIMILAPMNDNGGAGRNGINEHFQNLINPWGYTIPKTKIRVGDPVVQLKNDRKLNVRNGMTGQCVSRSEKAGILEDRAESSLVDLDKEEELLSVLFDEESDQTWYSTKNIKQLDLAYSITVHKAIGNQFDGVIVVLPYLPPMLRLRQIVYTAMSRAKKKLIVIASPHSMKACVENEERKRRLSCLAEFMKGR